ncbi:MAG: UDP-N-acetylglucosamine 2-epimerase (non-hydrolyzing) [Bacteroidales bacterium]|nr:UDP-N-acetylglucosamine 2-epimerase (non-hydrolyzing) [Bacteroidales bacterium]
MHKIAVLTGARPQIIKAAALHRAMIQGFSEVFNIVYIHSGQHYDRNLSEAGFLGLDIPNPDFNLGVGSASHAVQTAGILEKTESALKETGPACLILYGDTNTTLAGALAGSKLGIPVIHIEAGCRSFNKKMPEEINRIVCDQVSTLLFCPSETGLLNLKNEGFVERDLISANQDQPGIFNSGDIMLDNFLYYGKIADQNSDVLARNGLEPGEYMLCTIHRESNTCNVEILGEIMEGTVKSAENAGKKLVVPLHPRTRDYMQRTDSGALWHQLEANRRVVLMPPVSYLDILKLEKNAFLILTDSGGLQKEAYFAGKPCVILRDETEWVEVTGNRAGILAGANSVRIQDACRFFIEKPEITTGSEFGRGDAAGFIASALAAWLRAGSQGGGQ